MRKLVVGIAGILALAAATPASAVTFVTTGNSSTSGTVGNIRSFTAGTGASAITLKASAWGLKTTGTCAVTASTANTATCISKSYLGAYGQGLGVTSSGDSGTNLHTTDNLGDYQDFIILQFDKKVRLIGAQFSPFAVGTNKTLDTDATIGVGANNAAANQTIALTTRNGLNALFPTRYASSSTATIANTRLLDPSNILSRIWFVAAALETTAQQQQHDGQTAKNDAFKLSNIQVTTTVPEPATWLTMIAGFGFVGGAMRRRRTMSVST